MSRLGSAVFISVLFALAGYAAAQPKQEVPDAGAARKVAALLIEGEVVIVVGVVRRVGAEPFSELVITDSDETDWYIAPDSVPLLRGLEQRPVRVQGVLALRRMTLADGRDLPARRELSQIEVLSDEG